MPKYATPKLVPPAERAMGGAELVDSMLGEPDFQGGKLSDQPVEPANPPAPARRQRADARADLVSEMLDALEAEDALLGTPSCPDAPGEDVPRTAVLLPDSLVEEARNAAAYLSQPPEQLTVEQLVEFALRRDLARLRRNHLGGRMFPTSKIFRRRLRERKKAS